ncbi:acetyl-CoA C-acyltransferase [Schleiferiaceae bacterium]|nr:acetyl-CoA C-acyltransferase [Schleiferiaceae bacterium]
MKEVVIVSAVRTPMGSFGGALSSVPATALGAAAIKGALEKAGLSADAVEEVYMGNVLQANVGQAPARQAAMAAGIGNQVPCTTINKVCSSGMKAIMMGAQAIKAGDVEIIVAGGMENMSAVPHYLPTGRTGVKLGDISLVDGLVKDGLTDVYNAQHMGVCAELCAEEHQFTREDQDAFALESYRRSAAAWDGGKFANEVVPVAVPQRRGDAIVVDTDEEYTKVNTDKVPQLRPVFKKDGTVTAANASALNDGASAVVLMSASKAAELGLDPIARITGYADAAQEPEWFTTAPAKALPKALAKAGITMNAVDFFEFNEAFSVVGLANMKLLGLDAAKVNVHGGAVSLGHPLGASGARIITTLIGVLQQNGGKIGAAAICNGGGGASALVLELM